MLWRSKPGHTHPPPQNYSVTVSVCFSSWSDILYAKWLSNSVPHLFQPIMNIYWENLVRSCLDSKFLFLHFSINIKLKWKMLEKKDILHCSFYDLYLIPVFPSFYWRKVQFPWVESIFHIAFGANLFWHLWFQPKMSN